MMNLYFICRFTPIEANVPASAPEDLVINGIHLDLILSGGKRGLVPSGSSMNDTYPSMSEGSC